MARHTRQMQKVGEKVYVLTFNVTWQLAGYDVNIECKWGTILQYGRMNKVLMSAMIQSYYDDEIHSMKGSPRPLCQFESLNVQINSINELKPLAESHFIQLINLYLHFSAFNTLPLWQ